MADLIAAGTWVEIGDIVLEPGERAPQVPEDTASVALEMRVRGVLLAPTALGEEAEIETAAGRRLRGVVLAVNPAYDHSFGPPVPELAAIGDDLRAALRKHRDAQ